MIKKNLVFINSHPIQYFAPLYKAIEKDSSFDLEVWYCSKHGLSGELDKQFGVNVKWDIPLLEGYKYDFLSNSFGKANIYSFLGLRNFSIIGKLWKQPKSIIIIHGWQYLTNLLALFFGKLFGHTVCLRGESPLIHEPLENKFKMFLRKIRFNSIFRFADKCLYIGEQNKLFYLFFKVKKDNLIFVPYAVDNERFKKNYDLLHPIQDELKLKWKLPLDKRLVITSGKLIDKKRPLDLLEAFHLSNTGNEHLIFIGDGSLKESLMQKITELRLDNDVTVTGFVNQSEIVELYAIASLYVMPSGKGETWGLSTNEAMNFKLPVIISDMCGSAYDLVKEDKNGFAFQSGNISDLSIKLKQFFSLSEVVQKQMGEISSTIIDHYAYAKIIDNLNNQLL
jgi:glycosyltransferase involved in cell wall biosynthesis